MATVIDVVVENVKVAEERLKELEKLITLAKNAGENVAQYEIQYRDLKAKIERWKAALKAAGKAV
jgi:uncharacterized protein involved in exopolysaccharide biosynthesis